jgi:hypothetical protein
MDCSHGWSGGAAQPADAEPVGLTDILTHRPGGAKATVCTRPIPLPLRARIED